MSSLRQRASGRAAGARSNLRYPNLTGSDSHLRQAEERARRFEGLHSIATAIASELEVDATLTAIVNKICEYGPWASSCILRVDVHQMRMEVIAAHNLGPQFVSGYSLDASGSATLQAARTRQPLIVRNPQHARRFPQAMRHATELGYRALLLMPLPLDNQVVLNVYSWEADTFSGADLSYIAALASHAAIAIRKAQLYTQIRAQNATLRRMAETHATLIEMVLSGGSLQQITQTLSQVLGSAVVVTDRFDQILAAAPDTTVWKTLKPATSIPLVVGSELLGHLSIERGQVDELDRIACEQGALVVAVEMMKLRTTLDAEIRLRSDFMSDLLANHPAATYDRAAFLGWDPKRSHDLLLVHIHREDSTDEPGRLVKNAELLRAAIPVVERALAVRRPGAAAVAHREGLVVLLPTPAAEVRHAVPVEGLATHVQQELNRLFKNVVVSVGIGRRSTQLSDVHRAYGEAYRALQAAQSLNRTGQVVSFESLGLYALLFRDDDPDEMRSFVNRIIGSLTRNDEQRDTAYVATLRAYFTCNCNLRAAARQLDVHVNTLLHRLERVESISGLDLKNPDVRLNLHLALKLKELEGP